MRIRKLTTTALAVLGVGAWFAGPMTGSAPAAIGHAYISQTTGTFGSVVCNAVDGAENLYLAYWASGFVGRYDSTGASVAFSASEPYIEENKITGTPTAPGGFLGAHDLAAAVNNTSGELYIAVYQASGADGLYAYNAAGEFQWEVAGPMDGVAVDQADGNVFVSGYSGHSQVEEFSESGAYLTTISGTPSGQFYSIYECTLHVDSSGNVDVGEFGQFSRNSEEGRIMDIFGPDATVPTVLTGTPASGVSATAASVPGAITPEGGDSHWYFQYGLDENYTVGSTTPVDAGSSESSQEVSAKLSGLEPNIAYHYRLVGYNTDNVPSYGADQTFTTPPTPPAVDDAPASATDVTRETATLGGTVNPENSQTTSYFVYVDAAGYNPAAATTLERYGAGATTQLLQDGSGFGDVAVSPTQIVGLLPDTTYHYALVSFDQTGTSIGADHTFTTAVKTPPLASTAGAANVTQNTATITGVVNTQGEQTVYGFQIGTSPGDLGPITGLGPVGTGLSEATATLELNGLQQSTTYYYRVLATNGDGTTEGAVLSFTTTGYPNATLGVPSTLAQLATPTIAFPTGSDANTGKAKGKAKHRVKRRKAKRGRRTAKAKGRSRSKRRG